jgi:hypothetical protein
MRSVQLSHQSPWLSVALARRARRGQHAPNMQAAGLFTRAANHGGVDAPSRTRPALVIAGRRWQRALKP